MSPFRCHVDGCQRPHRAHHIQEAKRLGEPIPHPTFAAAFRRYQEERGQQTLFGGER